jgi:hypothetical protein
VLGRSHVNRSLRTSSYPDAIRAARRVAFEIESEFDVARRGVGDDAVSVRATSPTPSSPTVTAAAIPPAADPTIHIDLDALASRIADKLQTVPTARQATIRQKDARPIPSL